MLLKSFNDINNQYIEEIHNARQWRVSFIKNQIYDCIKNLIEDNEALVYAIWSDGRKENMERMSPWELLLITKTDDSIRANKLMNCLKSELHQSNKNTTMKILSYMEVQWPRYNNIFYYPRAFDEQHRVFFPTRFLDSHMLFWEEQNNKERKDAYMRDLAKVSKWDKREWKQRVRLHENISERWENTWKKEVQTHFWEDGICYDKNVGIERGIKLWPLRYLQYNIMKKIMGQKNLEMFDIFGKSTKEKLDIMSEANMLWSISEEELKFINQAYYYFLHIHHAAQTDFVKKRTPIEYKFASNTEKNEFFDVLHEFNKLIKNNFY